MKRICVALAAIGAATTLAFGADTQGCTINSDTGCGGDVPALTRGSSISTEFGGRYFPNDPVRGAAISVLAKTLPPNPIKSGTSDRG